jgi:hypothetical protein
MNRVKSNIRSKLALEILKKFEIQILKKTSFWIYQLRQSTNPTYFCLELAIAVQIRETKW